MLTAQDTMALEGQNEFDGSFDLDGFDTEGLDQGGNVDKEGQYHFEVADVVPELDILDKEGQPKTPSVRFDLAVLHTTPGQSRAGSRHFHRIYVGSSGGGPAKEGSIKSAIRFGLGLGILRQVEQNGKSIVVDAVTGLTRITKETWLRAKGQQCVAKIGKHEDKAGKYQTSFEIPFGRVYQVDHPDVADVPKNANALALIGKASAAVQAPKLAAAPSGSHGNGTHAPPVATAAPAAGWDNIGDL